MAANVDVIVFDKDKFFGELWIAHQLRDLLQDALARFVQRMRLARKHELHRPFRIVDQGGQLFDVRQNQVGALISGESPRKTYGERVRSESVFQLLQHGTGFVAAGSLLNGAAAHKFDHARLQVEVRLPELAIINVLNAIPGLGFAAAQMPSRAEMTIVEPE